MGCRAAVQLQQDAVYRDMSEAVKVNAGTRTHEVTGINSDECATSRRADSDFVNRIFWSFPSASATGAKKSFSERFCKSERCRKRGGRPKSDSHDLECLLNELFDGVSFASSEDEVIRLILLQHSPH